MVVGQVAAAGMALAGQAGVAETVPAAAVSHEVSQPACQLAQVRQACKSAAQPAPTCARMAPPVTPALLLLKAVPTIEISLPFCGAGKAVG